MEIVFALCLPRDEASVPFVRHMCRASMERLGVLDECISDIELAVTEACTNVLRHANGQDEEYEINVKIDETRCELTVVDTGEGFDHEGMPTDGAGDSAESGRGIYLMRALVDDLDFVSDPQVGTVVRLVKELALMDDSILKILARDTRPSADGASPVSRHADADGRAGP